MDHRLPGKMSCGIAGSDTFESPGRHPFDKRLHAGQDVRASDRLEERSNGSAIKDASPHNRQDPSHRTANTVKAASFQKSDAVLFVLRMK